MQPDWTTMFSLSMSPLEIIIRGSMMYWFIFLLLRMAGRRDVGSVGIADMLVLVLIADAAQNGMAGQYESITDGMILVATIIGWTVAIDRLAYYVKPIGRLLTADRVCLVQDGQIRTRNLRKEFITKDELLSELRQQGVDDVNEVHRAYIEADGNISVIKRT
ncbi:DUF421 domain-containing protein [Bordetella muralis]|uniref:DUF421 domain-containing protein n=1 Tax=Bordetella muralis TaxID=1649130 RepID=UPI0039EF2B53